MILIFATNSQVLFDTCYEFTLQFAKLLIVKITPSQLKNLGRGACIQPKGVSEGGDVPLPH